MKALIIDDERLARYELRRLLAVHPEVVVIGEAGNMPDGLAAIAELQPDLIFLDVQMPGGSGFDLLAALEATPAVIFTTAFDQYAIKAFDVSALDYLLKPIEPARLAHALAKYERLADAPKARPQASDGKVFIKDGERCWFVALEQIVLFESEGNYTRVYFDHNRPLLLRSLNQLEARLAATVKNKSLPLILICPLGARAARAVPVAKKLGFEQAQSLAGGLKAWKEANLPVEKA